MADKPKSENKPRASSIEIGADWNTNVVLLQEKAQNGIQLVNPMTMAIPMDAFLGAAFSLALQKLQREQEAKVRSLMPGGKPDIRFTPPKGN